jgi:adenine deaminase
MNLLIKNANVIDINKKKTFKGGVVVSGNKISEIFYDDNKIPEEYFERIIDANNNYLTPLFFDVYSKSELAMIKDPSRISSITQGIGMEIIGHGCF